MEEKKPAKYTEDGMRDKSSKRLTAMILLFFGMTFAIAGLVLMALEKNVEELVKYVFSFSIGSALVALGLTLPEMFTKK